MVDPEIWYTDAVSRGGAFTASPPAVTNEDVITDAVKRGDRRTALAELMRRHGQELYRFCASMLRDRTLADDVHQSVFIDAFESMNTFQGRSTWRVWLFGIARHRCLDAAKVRGRWSHRFSLAPDAGHDDPDPAERGDERLYAAQRARILLDCLRQLPGHVRVAVLLRYEQGLSYEEIGAACRERTATVQARVARALPVLRDCVTSKGASL